MDKLFSSLEKAIDILSYFYSENQEFSAQEISGQLSIPLSTTYKYLDVLLKKGFLSKNPDTKKIFLGLTIFKMGNLVAAKIKPIDVALRHMNDLANLSGETVTLTMIHGWESLCVEKIESSRRIKLSVAMGDTLPLHAGGSSKILLAYQDDAFVDAMIKNVGLVALTENTITDPVRLKNELKLIKSRGFAYSDSEVDYGARAAAAPVFDSKGGLAAGISVAGPRDRINDEMIKHLTEMVTECARKISYDLGYRPDLKQHLG
ncbi:MAG: IclR family transcriptional regulator [Desulfobacterales bacterium]|jgi:DNA-binding IclR family transcriptional regulator|nr:IclR family transcriptional regulator [Desulfobacterales bacterium]MCK5487036.1 IclR family transcriptional regulator [Desulfobacterales bacterium]